MPGSLLLYDNRTSSNAQKVRFLLAEIGAPYERREVPMGRPRPDWYLAENPRGLIPAIRDGELVLSESHAILRYLAARSGRNDLYPLDDAVARALIDELLDRLATGLRTPLLRHEIAAFGRDPETGWGGRPPDPEAAARIAEEIQGDLALLDRLVGDRFTVLDRLTIADCALAPALDRTHRSGLDLSPFPRLLALRESLTGRPGWRQVDAAP